MRFVEVRLWRLKPPERVSPMGFLRQAPFRVLHALLLSSSVVGPNVTPQVASFCALLHFFVCHGDRFEVHGASVPQRAGFGKVV